MAWLDSKAIKVQGNDLMPGDYIHAYGFVIGASCGPESTVVLYQSGNNAVFKFHSPDRWFIVHRSH